MLSLLYQIYDTYCLLTTSKTVCPQRMIQSFICYKMDTNVVVVCLFDKKELVLSKATLNTRDASIRYSGSVSAQIWSFSADWVSER